MTNYSVTTTTCQGTFTEVAAALEAAVEAVVDAKTIKAYQIITTGKIFYGLLVVAT